MQNQTVVITGGSQANTKDVQNAIEQILMEYQSIDVLVNNAGIVRDKLMLRMEESDFDDVMATNMKACFNTCKATIRSMIKKRRGKIINISSVVGLLGNAGQANYAASKAAIIGFSRSLAKELASRNITVNVIAPGFIDTAMADSLGEDKKDAIAQQIPLKRLGTPEEVAELAFFLAGPHANYITGSTFTIDGGISLGFSIKN